MNQPTLLLLAALPGEVYFSLGFVVLVGSIIVTRIRSKKREARMGTFEEPGADRKIRGELEELAVQVQEITREQIAKADVKIRMLNQLLIEADQKQKELEKLLVRELPPAEPRESPPEESPREPSRPANPLHEQIFSLTDAGKTPEEICGETGLEIGEVEMILGIRKL